MNEIDFLIENRSLGTFYAIEIKSGENFDVFDTFSRTGTKLSFVPDRLLMIDSYLTADMIDMIEYTCRYYAANLDDGCAENKLRKMLEADMNKGGMN